MRLFKAVDAGGDRSVSVLELKSTLYDEAHRGGGIGHLADSSKSRRSLTPANRASFGTCKSCKKEHSDLSHDSWRHGPAAGTRASLSDVTGKTGKTGNNTSDSNADGRNPDGGGGGDDDNDNDNDNGAAFNSGNLASGMGGGAGGGGDDGDATMGNDGADASSNHPLYTPVKKWFGWCQPCFKRETVLVEFKRRTTPEDFPKVVIRDEGSVGGAVLSEEEERRELLQWLRSEVRRRRVGSASLMGYMNNDRSSGASFIEFMHGLQMVDIDLERADYMRLFKAVDVGGDQSVTIHEMTTCIYGKTLHEHDPDKRALNPSNRGSYGTCKACKQENIDVSHSSWDPQDRLYDALYTPVKKWFGWCAECFEAETYVDPNQGKRRTTPDDFPPTREESGVTADEEREQLVEWLRADLQRRRVGSARLMGFMDGNRSDGASYNEFVNGLASVDIDLERVDYMRLFKAVDVGGDRNVSLQELKTTLYGEGSIEDRTPRTPPVGVETWVPDSWWKEHHPLDAHRDSRGRRRIRGGGGMHSGHSSRTRGGRGGGGNGKGGARKAKLTREQQQQQQQQEEKSRKKAKRKKKKKEKKKSAQHQKKTDVGGIEGGVGEAVAPEGGSDIDTTSGDDDDEDTNEDDDVSGAGRNTSNPHPYELRLPLIPAQVVPSLGQGKTGGTDADVADALQVRIHIHKRFSIQVFQQHSLTLIYNKLKYEIFTYTHTAIGIAI